MFSSICFLCESPTQTSLQLCETCFQQLPDITNPCKMCGAPIDENMSSFLCGQCLKTPKHYQESYIPMHYAFPIDHFIQQLKFKNKLNHLPLLSKILINYIADYHPTPLPEYLVPVPLHSSRIFQRGFNQATEIAKIVGKHFHIGYDTHRLQRILATDAQANLSAKMREKNVSHAFKTDCFPDFKHIAIIDDVVTTGSTVNAVAATLHAAGVKHIEVWAIARPSL